MALTGKALVDAWKASGMTDKYPSYKKWQEAGMPVKDKSLEGKTFIFEGYGIVPLDEIKVNSDNSVTLPEGKTVRGFEAESAIKYINSEKQLQFGGQLEQAQREVPEDAFDIERFEETATPEQRREVRELETPVREELQFPDITINMPEFPNIEGLMAQQTSMFDQAVNSIVEVIKNMLPPNKDPIELSEAELDDIMREAEATVGPQFTRLRERAEQDFSIAQRFAQENLQKLTRETEEDVGIKRKRMARNLQEAIADSAAAMANRQLTFGGTRMKEEEKLHRGHRESLEDLQRAAKRTTEGAQLGFEREFGAGALPGGFRSLTGEQGISQIGQQRTLEDITRERVQAQETEYQRRKGQRELSTI